MKLLNPDCKRLNGPFVLSVVEFPPHIKKPDV